MEVKTTLKVEDVKKHIKKRLKKFYSFFPEYERKQIYGGVAYIDVNEEADKFAYRQGLFVLALSGENLVEIKNDENFKPTAYGGEKEDE